MGSCIRNSIVFVVAPKYVAQAFDLYEAASMSGSITRDSVCNVSRT